MGESKTLFFNPPGYGHFDMTAYDRYSAGQLDDVYYPEAEIEVSLAGVCLSLAETAKIEPFMK